MSWVARSFTTPTSAIRPGRAPPAGDHLVDIPEIAGLDAGPCLLQRRVVALDVTHRPDEPCSRESVDECLGAGCVRRQRLLDQGMHPAAANFKPTSVCTIVGAATTT